MSFATLASNTRYAFGENRLTLIAVAMLAVMAICAVLGPVLAPYDPLMTNAAVKLTPPSAAHWFGTDALGRDILSRVIVAARLDLGMAISAVALSFVVGLATWRSCRIFRRLDGRDRRPRDGYDHGLPSVRSGHGHRRRARQ